VLRARSSRHTRRVAAGLAASAAALAASALALAAGAVAASGRAAAAPVAHSAIVGGRAAPTGTFPWLAYVQYNPTPNTNTNCTGAVVAADLVLTSAHCAVNLQTGKLLPASKFTIATGNVNLKQSSTLQVSDVAKVLVHPGYQPYDSFGGDAALLVLARPTTEPALPLAGPGEVRLLKAGTPDVVAGWGRVAPNDAQLISTLRWGTVVTQSPQYCARESRAHRIALDEQEEFCAIDPRFHVQVCYGDSGGPIIVEPTRRTAVAVGIATLARDCSARLPAIYTRTDFIYGWVQRMIAAYPVRGRLRR